MAPRAARAMPELPDVTMYVERLQAMLRGRVMEAVRIRSASNECNYSAPCQVGGRLLADRALSILLKAKRPRTLGEV